jgi:AAA domain
MTSASYCKKALGDAEDINPQTHIPDNGAPPVNGPEDYGLANGGAPKGKPNGHDAGSDSSQAARLRPLDLTDFLALKIKPREKLLDPILQEKALAMVYATRGTGKTFVALGIALAVASGTKFLKWTAPRPRRVLLVDGEMPAAALQERLASIVASAPDIDLDPSKLKILAADLIEAGGIGNLASFEVSANWIDGWTGSIC